jgi:hypothetical protein
MLFIARKAEGELKSTPGLVINDQELAAGTQEIVGRVLGWVGWGDTGDAAEIFRDRVPLLLLCFFVLASYFLPMLVALVSFDQFSELSTRGARFALLRVRRGAYFAGKAAAAAATVVILLGLLWTGVGLVAGLRGGPDQWVPCAREALRYWLLMCVLALPYLSLTALVSALARPAMAFLATLGAWFGLWLGAKAVDWMIPALLQRHGFDGLAAQVRRLLVFVPWQHAPRLISRDTGTVLSGALPLLALSALGFLAAFVLVRRRDV